MARPADRVRRRNPRMISAGLDHRHRRRRPAWAGCWPSPPPSSATKPHLRPARMALRGRCRRPLHARRVRRPRRAPRFRRTRGRRHLRVREFARRAARAARRHAAPGPEIARRRPGPGRGEKLHRIDRRPGRAVAPGRIARGRQAALAELGLPLVLKTRRYGYDGKGQAWIRSAGRGGAGLGINRQRTRDRRGRRLTSPPNSR